MSGATGLAAIPHGLSFGVYYHDHLPAFQARVLLNRSHFLQVRLDTLQQLDTQFLMRHLTAPETQSDLGLVPVL